MTATNPLTAADRQAFAPAGFFVLRTPLLPLDEWTAWSEGLSAAKLHAAGDAERRRGLDQDRALLWGRLREIMARPSVRHALYFAAPGVLQRLSRPAAAGSERDEKDRATLVRYFARMTGRPTPFGLFAGCSLGRVGGPTNLAIASRDQYKVFTTIDVGLLHGAMRDAAARLANPTRQSVHANPTLYRIDGQIRYVEVRTDPRTGGRGYHLAAAAATECLDHVLARAAAGRTVADLARDLRDLAPGVDAREADDFVLTLLSNGLLESTLEPGLTGAEPLTDAIGRLANVADPATDQLRAALRTCRGALRDIDQRGVGASPDRLDAAAAELRRAAPGVLAPSVFQADLFKPAPQAALSAAIADGIRDAALLLHRITPYRPPAALVRFREAFSARYQGGMVPLLAALDEEHGVGFAAGAADDEDASPWLSGLPPAADADAAWGPRDTHLLRRLLSAAAGGESRIELGPDDVAALRSGSPTPLPPCFAAIATLASRSAAALRRDDVEIFLHGLVGPSGAEFLGRFGHGSPEIDAAVNSWLAEEERLYPDALVAEIIHLPQGRTGNIICRPAWRRFEILCLGQSAAAGDARIPLSDLLVSVAGDRVTLWSRRLGCEIIPRLASADYAPTADLTMYRFLWMLQKQDAAALEWQWGSLSAAPFLPRVCAGNVILSRAAWRPDLSGLAGCGRDAAKAFGVLQELRTRTRMPRHVAMVDGGKTLPLDLENVFCVETVLRASRRQPAATFIEQFPGDDDLCVTSPEGRFVHEIILPFRSTRITPASGAARRPACSSGAEPPLRRAHGPGSEWLYMKLYGSPPVLEDILLSVIAPTLQALAGRAEDGRWFFVRYWDPDPHLRIRLRGPPRLLTREALPDLHAAIEPWLGSGKIHRVQLDTYLPEIERFGGPLAIAEAESFFASDSAAALALLALDRRRDGDIREHLAATSVRSLLDGFRLDAGARQDFTGRIRHSLLAETTFTAGDAACFGITHRRVRPVLDALTGASTRTGADLDGEAWIGAARRILAGRAAAAGGLDQHLRTLEQARQLTTPRLDVLASVAHMSVNRLMRSDPRRVELAIYDMLHRCAMSDLARR